jgi:sterol 3beta-glucosyltransferase
VSLDIPERFRDAGDAEEDVAVPKLNNTISMHQSIFSMIARVGQQSQTDLGITEEVDSGDGDSDNEARRSITYGSLDGAARMSRLSSVHDFQRPLQDVDEGKVLRGKHRRTLSEHRLLRSLPKLKISSRKESRSEAQTTEAMSSSQFLPPRPSGDVPSSSRDESKQSESASARDAYTEKRQGSERNNKQETTPSGGKGKTTMPLANRLQQIFDFEGVEEVISGL